MAAGAGKPWLRWLHRIGYVATAIVLAELAFVAVLSVGSWLDRQRSRARQMEETRTRSGPLVAVGRYVQPDERDLLSPLPPLPPAPAIGARFAAMPYLHDTWYAISVSLRPGEGRATGVLVAFDAGGAPKYKAGFSLPAADMQGFVARLDARTAGWPGDAQTCLDGTGMAFELRTVRGVSSGSGNAGCTAHYRAVGALALGLVSTVLPAAGRPVDGEWYPATPR